MGFGLGRLHTRTPRSGRQLTQPDGQTARRALMEVMVERSAFWLPKSDRLKSCLALRLLGSPDDMITSLHYLTVLFRVSLVLAVGFVLGWAPRVTSTSEAGPLRYPAASGFVRRSVPETTSRASSPKKRIFRKLCRCRGQGWTLIERESSGSYGLTSCYCVLRGPPSGYRSDGRLSDGPALSRVGAHRA
jgi:hypothetical protein